MFGSKSAIGQSLVLKGKSVFLKAFHSIIHDPLSVLRCLNKYLFFSICLSSQAKSEVFVVNPFIHNCDLNITPKEDKKTRICVQIITRITESGKNELQNDHVKIKKESISLIHNNRLVHAKILLVDRTVSILSSVNFCPSSSAGVSWEAGLVSTDDKIVKSTIKSVLTKFT
jgi:hypothetical protein